jgi:hypothetical protein
VAGGGGVICFTYIHLPSSTATFFTAREKQAGRHRHPSSVPASTADTTSSVASSHSGASSRGKVLLQGTCLWGTKRNAQPSTLVGAEGVTGRQMCDVLCDMMCDMLWDVLCDMLCDMLWDVLCDMLWDVLCSRGCAGGIELGGADVSRHPVQCSFYL